MKLPDMRIKLPDLPRKVLISAAVLGASAIVFGLALPLLGDALDTAVVENQRLNKSIDQATRDTATVNADYKFATENAEEFEKLINSDRLIPHTRRDALRQLQSLAQEHGLTALNAEFAAANDNASSSVAKQTNTDAYRVNAESIKIKLGSSLDGQIYGFAADLRRTFPGAAVLMSMKLARPPKVTPDMLDHMSKSAIVTGDMELLWRTALANEPEKKP